MKYARGVFVITTFIVACVGASVIGAADSFGLWVDNTINAGTVERTSEHHFGVSDCRVGYQQMTPDTAGSLCTRRIGVVAIGTKPMQSDSRLYVSIGNDARFHAINGTSVPRETYTLLPSPKGLRLIKRTFTGSLGWHMRVYDDMISRLNLTPDDTYTFDWSNPDFVFGPTDAPTPILSAAFSQNGKYAVVAPFTTGPIRIDLNNHAMHSISALTPMSAGGTYELAVSDDGNYVAMVSGTMHRIYDVNSMCGVSGIQALQPGNECPFKDIHAVVATQVTTASLEQEVLYKAEFASNTELVMHFRSAQISAYIGEWPYGKLDYLALGDSYSSGEGDIGRRSNGGSYYSAATDYPGGCHLSERSYPFLLRDKWGIDPMRMQSVACSGAQVVLDYTSRMDGYNGQGGRLKEMKMTDTQIKQRKARALEAFLPGNVPQLEFVKKYKPKVVTVMGGGNDVGFENILKYCATPEIVAYVVIVEFDCDYAIPGTTLAKMLDASIKSQAMYTSRLLEKIKEYSPETKVYLVGYPIFVDVGHPFCHLSVGTISMLERKAMMRMTVKLNNILESVATRYGVEYVDIANSLEGGRMCGGGRYVTDLFELGLKKAFIDKDVTESFHPNHQGHIQIAKEFPTTITLDNKEPVYDEQIVQAGVAALQIRALQTAIPTTLQRKAISFEFAPYTFKPLSQITITGHSTPRKLGTFTANEDGSLAGTLDLSSLEIGRHVVTYEGQSYSGDEFSLYEFMEMRASESDADGDGVPDRYDRCQYLKHVIDETGKDVCDLRQTISQDESEKQMAISLTDSIQQSAPPNSRSVVDGSGASMSTYGTGRLSQSSTRKGGDVGRFVHYRESAFSWFVILLCMIIIGGGVYAKTHQTKA